MSKTLSEFLEDKVLKLTGITTMHLSTSNPPVTISRADAAFIAHRLKGHAKLQRKKLANAVRKELNRELVKKLQAEIAECIRLANALHDTAEEACLG